jgi:aspartate aminotransferase
MINTSIRLSKIATNLASLSIIKISEGINEKIRQGAKIFNFTIGDFSPKYFPIPQELENAIITAYHGKNTNYPLVGGILELRTAIANFINEFGRFKYTPDEIVVGSGARPLIYTVFKTLVDPGDKVINIVPSWNNYNYIQLADAVPVVIAAKSENDFLVTAAELKPHLPGATLLALNSPLNPSGTVFKRETLKEIIDLVIQENKTRKTNNEKPLYVFFDMIYWLLTYGDTKYFNPIELNPEIRDYIIFVDGISKAFAATGVRVGWAFGPKEIIDKMRSIISHVGAWTPKPEQVGTAIFLEQSDVIRKYLAGFRTEILMRLNIIYEEIIMLKNRGFKVDAIKPEGAIYLTVKFDLVGMHTKSGKILQSVDDIFHYLIDEASVALVPFYAFGAARECLWFRVAVTSSSIAEITEAANNLRMAIERLQ